ncbi:PQQ-binding-like beta-propeller repeat protein [Aestuariivivens sediminis]|uniref:outer membrane protein assembly factor BamB family protein n=1 Tax=Aestuariivivens sediminis TaxID=2913557 RepID=UPI001F56132B|nr:PQQ-binding-like beta-propeller repeat protein [Aestuariivivens sediminis]
MNVELKIQIIFNKIISISLAVFSFVFFLGLTSSITNAQENVVLKYQSGDDEIDQIRKEIKLHPTDASNYKSRGVMLMQWGSSLQQQGAITTGRIPAEIFRPKNIEAIRNEKEKQQEINRYSKLIDKGYLILDSIQNEIIEDPWKGLMPLVPDHKSVIPPVKNEKSWPNYQGTLTNEGFNGNDGPVYGRIAWRFPVGLAWESKPVINGNKVYLASPGIHNILFTLDINSGEAINTVKQLGGRAYGTPAYASTPVVLKDYVLMREMGSKSNAMEVAYINKSNWELERKTYSGQIDYRAGYAPLAANEKYMVFPFSDNDIEARPPKARGFSRIICKDTKTGKQLRDISIGSTFAEPLLDDDEVFVGTNDGYVYSFKAYGSDLEKERSNQIAMSKETVINWKFKADDAVNRKVATDTKQVYFGANDGVVYCLNKMNGDLVWKYTVENPIAESFRHFSTPLVSGNRIFIGSADKHLYCLDASSGKLIFKYASSDWVRACPVATEANVYFASMNGDLYNIDFSGKEPKEVWTKRIGDHWVYADLALSGDKLILNDSDLYSYCINTKNGDVLWRFSILKGFHQKDGYRILTDQIAGGGYYQSKVTAAEGKVFIGTPSRFVYAMDADNGKEIWKFEMGAAISGAPVFDNDKIYVGQQGGEDDFYCLNAKTGELIWKQDIGWDWGSASVSDGLVFIPGIDGYFNCLDANNGNIIWRFRIDRSVCSEPLVMGEYVYFGGWDSHLYKFEKRTGKLVWKFQGGGSDSGVAVGFDGKILCPGGGSGGTGIKVIDAETSEVLWRPEIIGHTNGTPAYHNGQWFVSIWDGQLIALDDKTGKKNWTVKGASGITGPVVGNNGYVYCGSGVNPYFFAFKEKGNGDGTTDCLFRVKMAGGLLEATPALYRGRAYILSGGGYLYAIE